MLVEHSESKQVKKQVKASNGPGKEWSWMNADAKRQTKSFSVFDREIDMTKSKLREANLERDHM